jgi:type II secretory pathway pseudopilin PulG
MNPTPEAPTKTSRNIVFVVVIGVLLAGGCGVLGILAAILFPVFQQARIAAKSSNALSNAKDIGIAISLYTNEYDDHLPPAIKWMDATVPSLVEGSIKTFRSPALKEDEFGLAFYKPLSGMLIYKVRDVDKQPMFFDSDLTQRNATSGLETMPKAGRWQRNGKASNIVGFLDGSVRFVPITEKLETEL